MNGDSYLNHVSKGRVVEVVTQAADANTASPLASLKKPDAVAGAEQVLAGKGWLPNVLRVGAQCQEGQSESAVDQGDEGDGGEAAATPAASATA